MAILKKIWIDEDHNLRLDFDNNKHYLADIGINESRIDTIARLTSLINDLRWEEYINKSMAKE